MNNFEEYLMQRLANAPAIDGLILGFLTARLLRWLEISPSLIIAILILAIYLWRIG